MKNSTDYDYNKIFNILKWLSFLGVFFIAFSIPALFGTDVEAEYEEPTIKPTFTLSLGKLKTFATVPDTSYAFEIKANREAAKERMGEALYILEYIDSVEPEVEEVVNTVYVGEFYITMYAATVEQCGNDLGITASGRPCTDDPTCWTVAVDPKVIPLGTYLIIEGYDGIVFRADDTGSAINGYDIDIFTTSESESKQFANQSGVKVWIIED